jgi:hypothetical protein
VDVKVGGDVAVQMLEKGQELLMAMAWFALRNHAAIEHAEGRKQRGSAVAEIVVSDAFDVTQIQGQRRLGAFERLDLAFFVHTQDQGVIWRIEVKAYYVAHLFHEEGSVESLKLLERCGWSPKSLK